MSEEVTRTVCKTVTYVTIKNSQCVCAPKVVCKYPGYCSNSRLQTYQGQVREGVGVGDMQ